MKEFLTDWNTIQIMFAVVCAGFYVFLFACSLYVYFVYPWPTKYTTLYVTFEGQN